MVYILLPSLVKIIGTGQMKLWGCSEDRGGEERFGFKWGWRVGDAQDKEAG